MRLMTEIDHLWEKNLPIVITEYLNGSFCWFSIRIWEGDNEYSSHCDHQDHLDDQVIGLLERLAEDYGNVDIIGTICGPGHGVNDYGLEDPTFIPTEIYNRDTDAPFPIKTARDLFKLYAFRTAPVLFAGPFSRCQVVQHLRRPSKMAPASMIKTPFKTRCGVVFTPQEPQFVEELDNWLEGWQPSIEYAELMGIEHGLPINSSDDKETRA